MTDMTSAEFRDRELVRQIEADIRLKDVQARWEPWKALAAIALSVAAMTGAIIGLSSYLQHRPATPPTVIYLKDAAR